MSQPFLNSTLSAPTSASARTVARMALPHQARGVTLLELMIGIAVGMLVSIAAMSTLVGTKRTQEALTDAALMEQQASAIMAIIGEQIRQAGAVDLIAGPPGSAPGVVRWADYAGVGGISSTVAFPVTRAISAVPDEVDDSSDRLTISMTSGPGTVNCLGDAGTVAFPETPPAGSVNTQQVVSAFRIDNANDAGYDASKGRLLCSNGLAASTPEEVGSGIRQFKVFFLRNDAPVATATQPAAPAPVLSRLTTKEFSEALAANADAWANVDAIEICLHMWGDFQSLPDYELAGVDCDGKALEKITDGRYHRYFRQVFQMRNAVR